jgi:hypothetical protein
MLHRPECVRGSAITNNFLYNVNELLTIYTYLDSISDNCRHIGSKPSHTLSLTPLHMG